MTEPAAQVARGARRELVAIVVLYGYRLVTSFVIAYPAAKAFAAFGAAPFDAGDRVLFEEGGVRLLEALRFSPRAVAGALQSASLGFLALSSLGLLPLAWAMTWLARPSASAAEALALALPRVPGFLLAWGGTWLLRVGYATLAALALSGVTSMTGGAVNEQWGDLVVLAAALLLAVGLLVLELLQDVVRAVLVEGRPSVTHAAQTTLSLGYRNAGPVLGRGLGFALAGAVALALGALLTGALDVSQADGKRIAAVFVAHQAAVLVLVSLRVRWLGWALTLVRSAGGGLGASGGDGLLVDLDVAASRAVPGEIEPHDPAT